jgi:hypothetical protein
MKFQSFFAQRRIEMKKNKRAQRSKDDRTNFLEKEIREYDEEQLSQMTGGGEELPKLYDKKSFRQSILDIEPMKK